MNWLYVTATTLQQTGGQSTHIREFCTALARRAQVALVSPQAAPVAVPAGVAYYPVRLPHRAMGPSFDLKLLLRALRRPPWPKPDVVYMRAGVFNSAPLLYARRLGIPCILEINGDLVEEYAAQHRPQSAVERLLLRLRLATYATALGWSYRAASALVVVTAELGDMVVQRYGVKRGRVSVVPNGVNLEIFTPRDAERCQQQLGLRSDRRYVGYIGTLAIWQDVLTLMDGFARVASSQPDVDLLIVGDGALRGAVEERRRTLGLQQRIHLTGAVPYTEVPLYLAACSIATAPKRPLRESYAPHSPLKAYEALGCGRPLLATDQPSMRFIVDEGVGLLYQAENSADLAQQLERLLQLPDSQLAEMGQRARRLAEERYSWDAVVAQIEDLARRLAHTNSSR